MRPDPHQLLDQKSAEVDRALEAFLRSDPRPVENLHDATLYALGLDQQDPAIRGKRIRPALCLITCEALDGDTQKALPFAMAIELMHNFFLVHDDIEDGDQFRRGRPSVWKRYGLAHAVNIGDFLFTKAFAALLSRPAATNGAETDGAGTDGAGTDGAGTDGAGTDGAGTDGVTNSAPSGVEDLPLQFALCRLLVETLECTHVGQAQDINALRSRDITIEQYLEIVTNKTGYYLAAPMLGGAMVAGATPQTLEAIRNLGKCVGPVFQIVDDTIDLTHGKGRETVGSDVREGKRSYLVAWAASKASAAERDEMFRILDLPREETTPEHVAWVRALFDRVGAIEAGRAHCRKLMDQAHAAMSDAPARLRDTLLALFEALLERKK
jgi:geranylgeranyl pyrophosphate synthase